MLNRGNYFAGQNRDEKILHVIRRHWVAFIPVILYFAVCFFLPVILYLVYFQIFISYPKTIYYIITIIFSSWDFVVIWFTFRAWIEFYFDVTIITTNHLVDINQGGLFHRKVSEQSFLVVQDVSSRMKGILQTFFKYGTVFVETAGESPNFVMNNIPNPNEVSDIIMNLHKKIVERNDNKNPQEPKENKIIELENNRSTSNLNNQQESDQVDQEITDYLTEDQPKESLVFDFNSDKISSDDNNDLKRNSTDKVAEGNLEEGKSIQID